MTRPKPDDLSAAQEKDLNEIQGSRWRKFLTRALALLLALAFITLAFGGVLRLWGMPALGFLLESRTLSRDPQIKAWTEAVVAINADNRMGTGFNIDPQGLIITNNHVVEGAKQASINFSANNSSSGALFEGSPYVVHEWTPLPQIDLAIIPLTGENLPFLELETETLPKQGDALILIGNPLGFFRVVNRAAFVGYTELSGWDTPVLLIKGPVYKGNSGSPVLNAAGKVIGVIFATVSQPQQGSEEILAFALPVAEIIKHIETK